MEIEIDLNKSAQDNANDYFNRSKKAKRKAEGAELAVKELEAKKKGIEGIEQKRRVVKKIEKKEWYERFNWFMTSGGMLAIGGRNAQQNELINSKYFESNDLFFHADVFGASAVILKNGVESEKAAREEAAQFAACFSRAWEGGSSSATVYSLKREQISKSKEKGALGTGSFLMSGEREWFKNIALELAAFMDNGRIRIVPMSTCIALQAKGYLVLKPGNRKKSDAAKMICGRLGFGDIDYVMQHLPAGGFSLKP
ncbi:MAG: DUF814 domain-containing protein [Candidatus Micrarchaeota archaeon]|nr:DUF814 domain-containing protein [Candidatus Micrarchaeota archaeon]